MRTDSFSPRDFLRQRGALLVHFNTVMGCEEFPFPLDLQQAMTLQGVPLSFSTIQVGDTNPHAGGRGGAEGSVGLAVDIGVRTIVESVCSGDSGSSPIGSLGRPPTEVHCAESIDKRRTSNEWRVQDYVPIGIFILPPILVRMSSASFGSVECQIDLKQAIEPFPHERVFSVDGKTFLELDRTASAWRVISYGDIIQG